MAHYKPDTLQRTILSLESDKSLGDRYLRHSYLLAPFFQGVLMEQLSPEYAEELHNTDVNPYSQFIQAVDRQDSPGSLLAWTINTINSTANECFAIAIDAMKSGFELRATGHQFRVASVTTQTLQTSTLAKLCYEEPASNRFNLNLLTPTAFKQQGRYAFTPDLHLLFQSLQQKYNVICEGTKEVEQEELEYIVTKLRITEYSLRSQYFNVGSNRVPGFMGRIQLAVDGPSIMQGYIWMLLRFGEYSGLGVKSAMGMGAIGCSQIQKKPLLREKEKIERVGEIETR